MTTDAAWLSDHAFLMLVDATVTPGDVRGAVSSARSAGLAGVVLYPSHLALSGDTGDLVVASVVGFPTGRHHTLVKAAEARLAVAQGATEVWLTPDPTQTDVNALLAEFVAVREAVPPPVTLVVILESALRPDVREVAEAAARAGVDRLVTDSGWFGGTATAMSVPLPYLARAEDLEAVISALEQGADRVGVTDVAAVCPPPR